MDIELISFKICPFVQRTVITLRYKHIPYKVSYIDLGFPPEWFKQLSPFGKVPVLKIDKQHVIFESAVINELLNDLYSMELLPRDDITRAISRSWIEFGSTLTLDFSGLIHSNSPGEFDNKLQTVKKEFDWLEEKLSDGPYFNGEQFSLVDIAFAPLFMRVNILSMSNILFPTQEFPKVTAWAERLLAIPELQSSVVDDFESLFVSHIKNKAPHVAAQLHLV